MTEPTDVPPSVTYAVGLIESHVGLKPAYEETAKPEIVKGKELKDLEGLFIPPPLKAHQPPGRNTHFQLLVRDGIRSIQRTPRDWERNQLPLAAIMNVMQITPDQDAMTRAPDELKRAHCRCFLKKIMVAMKITPDPGLLSPFMVARWDEVFPECSTGKFDEKLMRILATAYEATKAANLPRDARKTSSSREKERNGVVGSNFILILNSTELTTWGKDLNDVLDALEARAKKLTGFREMRPSSFKQGNEKIVVRHGPLEPDADRFSEETQPRPIDDLLSVHQMMEIAFRDMLRLTANAPVYLRLLYFWRMGFDWTPARATLVAVALGWPAPAHEDLQGTFLQRVEHALKKNDTPLHNIYMAWKDGRSYSSSIALELALGNPEFHKQAVNTLEHRINRLFQFSTLRRDGSDE